MSLADWTVYEKNERGETVVRCIPAEEIADIRRTLWAARMIAAREADAELFPSPPV